MARRLEMPPRCKRCEIREPRTDLGFCYACAELNVWDERVRSFDNPNYVRVKGEHYTIRPDPDPKTPFYRLPTGGLGFGGREFRIRFKDGRTVVTHNLWSDGKIPEDYLEALPDNARFLKVKRKEVVRNR